VDPSGESGSRLRIYVAGAWAAPITNAVQVALVQDARVVQVGLDLDELDRENLRRTAPDLLVSAAHSRLIRPEELVVPRIGAIGIHPSLLPRYRGSHPLWWALKNGEGEVGVTIYRLDAGIDTGNILAQRSYRVLADDTFESLYQKAVRLIPPMLSGLFTTILETGSLPVGTPQDHSLATYFKPPQRRDTASMRLIQARRRLRRGARAVRERDAGDG
jgi:methionyl-tRNA formyltransferase